MESNGRRNFRSRDDGGLRRDIEKLFSIAKRLQSEVISIKRSYSKAEHDFFISAQGQNVSVLLLSGVKMSGQLINADKYCIYLNVEGKSRLIPKSAVACVDPA